MFIWHHPPSSRMQSCISPHPTSGWLRANSAAQALLLLSPRQCNRSQPHAAAHLRPITQSPLDFARAFHVRMGVRRGREGAAGEQPPPWHPCISCSWPPRCSFGTFGTFYRIPSQQIPPSPSVSCHVHRMSNIVQHAQWRARPPLHRIMHGTCVVRRRRLQRCRTSRTLLQSFLPPAPVCIHPFICTAHVLPCH